MDELRTKNQVLEAELRKLTKSHDSVWARNKKLTEVQAKYKVLKKHTTVTNRYTKALEAENKKLAAQNKKLEAIVARITNALRNQP